MSHAYHANKVHRHARTVRRSQDSNRAPLFFWSVGLGLVTCLIYVWIQQGYQAERYKCALSEEKRKAQETIIRLVDHLEYAIQHNADARRTLLYEALQFVTDDHPKRRWEQTLNMIETKAADSPPGVQLTRISSEPETGTVVVSCRDQSGAFVSDLSTRDFHVVDSQGRLWPHFSVREEKGRIVDASVILLVDRSLSMEGERMLQLKTGLLSIVDSFPGSTNLRLVTFNHKVESITGFTRDHKQVQLGIEGLTVDGATAIADALSFCLNEMQPITGPKTIVLCTDGQDEKLRTGLKQLAAQCRKSDVVIHVLAIDDPTLDRKTLHELSATTGGVLAVATKPSEIVTQLQSIVKAVDPTYRVRIFPGDQPFELFSVRLRGAVTSVAVAK